MKNLVIISFFVTFLLSSSCDPQRQIAGYYSYETECLGVELDGSQTLRTWGSGRNRSDAVEQAKKNAIKDVLFKGITKGKDECNVKPVLVEVNVQEKNQDYFFRFFADNGPYKEFITGEDGSDLHFTVIKGRSKAADQETYGVIVRVQRAKLRERMISDNIIK